MFCVSTCLLFLWLSQGITETRGLEIEREKWRRSVYSASRYACHKAASFQQIGEKRVYFPLANKWNYDLTQAIDAIEKVESIYPKLQTWLQTWDLALSSANSTDDKTTFQTGSRAFKDYGIELLKSSPTKMKHQTLCAKSQGFIPAPRDPEAIHELVRILKALNLTKTYVNYELGGDNEIYTPDKHLVGFLSATDVALLTSTDATNKINKSDLGVNAALALSTDPGNDETKVGITWVRSGEEIDFVCLKGELMPLQDKAEFLRFQELRSVIGITLRNFQKFTLKFKNYFAKHNNSNSTSGALQSLKVIPKGLISLATLGTQLLQSAVRSHWDAKDLSAMWNFATQTQKFLMQNKFIKGIFRSRFRVPSLRQQINQLSRTSKGFVTIARTTGDNVEIAADTGKIAKIFLINPYIVHQRYLFKFSFYIHHENGGFFTNKHPKELFYCDNENVSPCSMSIPSDATLQNCMAALDAPSNIDEELRECYGPIKKGYLHIFSQKCDHGPESCITSASGEEKATLECSNSRLTYSVDSSATQCFPACDLSSSLAHIDGFDSRAKAPEKPRVIELGKEVEYSTWLTYFGQYGISGGNLFIALTSVTLALCACFCSVCLVLLNQHESCQKMRSCLCTGSLFNPFAWFCKGKGTPDAPSSPEKAVFLEFQSRDTQQELDPEEIPLQLNGETAYIRLADGRLIEIPDNMRVALTQGLVPNRSGQRAISDQ